MLQIDRRFIQDRSIYVKGMGLTAAPSDPKIGDRYIISTVINTNGDAWKGVAANSFAYYDGTRWIFSTPERNEVVMFETGGWYIFNGSAWQLLDSGGGGGGGASDVGIYLGDVNPYDQVPNNPSIGDKYRVGSISDESSPWYGHENEVAFWNGLQWIFSYPVITSDGNALYYDYTRVFSFYPQYPSPKEDVMPAYVCDAGLGDTLPATCTKGQKFLQTSASALPKVHIATADDTWTEEIELPAGNFVVALKDYKNTGSGALNFANFYRVLDTAGNSGNYLEEVDTLVEDKVFTEKATGEFWEIERYITLKTSSKTNYKYRFVRVHEDKKTPFIKEPVDQFIKVIDTVPTTDTPCYRYYKNDGIFDLSTGKYDLTSKNYVGVPYFCTANNKLYKVSSFGSSNKPNWSATDLEADKRYISYDDGIIYESEIIPPEISGSLTTNPTAKLRITRLEENDIFYCNQDKNIYVYMNGEYVPLMKDNDTDTLPTAVTDTITVTAANVTAKSISLSEYPTYYSYDYENGSVYSSVLCFVNGIAQPEGTAFEISGNTLSWNGKTLEGKVSAGDVFIVQYQY